MGPQGLEVTAMESVASATQALPPQTLDRKELCGIKEISNHSEELRSTERHGRMQSFEEKMHGCGGEQHDDDDDATCGVSPSPDCSLSARRESSSESGGVSASSFSKVCVDVDPTAICDGGSDAVNPFASKVSGENDAGTELRCAYVSTTSSPAGGSAFGSASGTVVETQEDAGADNGGLLSESFFDPAAASSPSASSDAQHNPHIGGYQLHGYGASPTSSSPVADASFAYGSENACSVFGYAGGVNVFGTNSQLPSQTSLSTPQTHSAPPLQRGSGSRYIGDTSVNLAAQMVEAEQALRTSRSVNSPEASALHEVSSLDPNSGIACSQLQLAGETRSAAGSATEQTGGDSALSTSSSTSPEDAKVKGEEEGAQTTAALRGVRAAAKSSLRGCGVSALRNKKERRCWGGRVASSSRGEADVLSGSGSAESSGGGKQICAFQRSSLSVRLGELVKRVMQGRHKIVWIDRCDARGLLPLPGIDEEGVYCVWTDKGLDVLVEVHHVVPSYLCPVSGSSRERMTLKPFLVLGSTSFAQLFQGVCRRSGTLVHCKPKVVNTRVYSAGKKNKAALSVGLPATEEENRADPSSSRPCTPDALPATEGRRRVFLGPPPSPVDWPLHYITKKGRVVGEDYVFYRQRTSDDQGAPVYNIQVTARKMPKAVAKHHFHFDDPRPRVSASSSREEKEPSESQANGEDFEDSERKASNEEPSLLPLEAEEAALQQLKMEKEKFLSENEARSGWRGWAYAEDNCDFDGFDNALGLPASLAMEVRVLLGLQPSIMAHRCNISLANHRIVSSLQRRCRFFVLSPEGDERIAEVQPFGDGAKGPDEAWMAYRAQQLRLSNSTGNTTSERKAFHGENSSAEASEESLLEAASASDGDAAVCTPGETSTKLRKANEDAASAALSSEEGASESPSNISSKSRSRYRRSLSGDAPPASCAVGTRKGRRTSKARAVVIGAGLTDPPSSLEENDEQLVDSREDENCKEDADSQTGCSEPNEQKIEAPSIQGRQTASKEDSQVGEETPTADLEAADAAALDIISLDELKAESMRSPDANSLVSSLRLPEGARVEVEFPTEFHSFMETDRVRIVSKEQLIAALGKLKEYAEHYSKPLDFSAINLAQNATNLYWNLSRFDSGGCVEAALHALCPSCASRLKRRRACAIAIDDRPSKTGRARAAQATRDLRRQNEVDAFFEFMSAEFEKRSIRLKEKKAELDKLETDTRKSRLPAVGDSDESALVTAFIDVESGVLKRPFSLVSTAQRRVLYMYCLRNNLHANIRICKIAGKGRAVVAADTIRKDDFVLEYKGELCSEREARERDLRYDRSRSLKGSFMFYFKHKDRQMSIDATEERREFGPARLINHSRKNPNLRPKAEALDGQAGDLRLFFIALRDIQEGEELLVDYGERDPEALKQNPWLNE